MRKFEFCTRVLETCQDRKPTEGIYVLPTRKTKHSAGYDFACPKNYLIQPGETVKIPTGIKVLLNDNEFLALIGRSGLGIKHGLSLPNCVGIIDADYYNNKDNEGEIIGAITNHSSEAYMIYQGDTFMQGIIMEYHVTDDDNATGVREGGLGSTGR